MFVFVTNQTLLPTRENRAKRDRALVLRMVYRSHRSWITLDERSNWV
jgi:hypothetical protein